MRHTPFNPQIHCAGTARLQLQHKGDYDHTYTDLANILPCAGVIGLPVISWLLDKKARVWPTRLHTIPPASLASAR